MNSDQMQFPILSLCSELKVNHCISNEADAIPSLIFHNVTTGKSQNKVNVRLCLCVLELHVWNDKFCC